MEKDDNKVENIKPKQSNAKIWDCLPFRNMRLFWIVSPFLVGVLFTFTYLITFEYDGLDNYLSITLLSICGGIILFLLCNILVFLKNEGYFGRRPSSLVIALSIIIVGQLGSELFQHYSGEMGKRFLAPLNSLDLMQTELINTDDLCEYEMISYFNDEIVMKKNHHKRTFLRMYKFYFSSITSLIIFSIFSALFAFLIAQKGWEKTDRLIKTVFLTCAVLTSFYAISINAFKQDVVIKKNINSYINYDNLRIQMFSYLNSSIPIVTGGGDTINSNDELNAYMTSKLIELNNIYVEFDKNAIVVKDGRFRPN
ncbi:MAG: hypothetical protein GY751_12430 [Bacteroidetes bacterium]|nr:hypothetical protein [Bacteroidota bacterium]